MNGLPPGLAAIDHKLAAACDWVLKWLCRVTGRSNFDFAYYASSIFLMTWVAAWTLPAIAASAGIEIIARLTFPLFVWVGIDCYRVMTAWLREIESSQEESPTASAPFPLYGGGWRLLLIGLGLVIMLFMPLLLLSIEVPLAIAPCSAVAMVALAVAEYCGTSLNSGGTGPLRKLKDWLIAHALRQRSAVAPGTSA